MDINDFRGLITVVIMIAFLGICAWAFSGRQKRDFEATAGLPLEDDKLVKNDSQEKS